MSQKHATTVAEALVGLGNEKGVPLTPMALIKLVYLCHGWSLALRSKPLIIEDVEAWQYGPVISDLYDAVKYFRASAVTHIPVGGGKISHLDEDDSSLVKAVFDSYKHLSGTELSELTHQPETPWSEIWKKGKKVVIPNELIKKHFNELVKG